MMPIEDYLDRRRFELLAAIVQAVKRNVGSTAVKPEDIGEELGLTADEIQEYTTYWRDMGCLRSLDGYRVVITASAIDTIDEAAADQ
jgi:predicted transcriptional regulator